MGTPFQGSSKTKWAEVGKWVVTKLPIAKANSELLDDLEERSKDLARLADHFSRWRLNQEEHPETKVRVVCFHEGVDTFIGGIVSEESAEIMGYGKLCLEADHQGMCKYSGREDPKYTRVLGVLQHWFHEIKGRSQDSESQGVRVHSC